MSRKEVIKLLKLIKSTVYLGNRKFFDAIEFAINYLNQPEQRWIPCSERLPKEDVEVLVTDDAGGITAIDVDRCGMYEDTKERFWYTSQHVIAWMPLPEPYKEGIDDYKNM